MSNYSIYLIAEVAENPVYKIGYTSRQAEQRLNELKTANAKNLEIVQTFSSRWGTKIESRLHQLFEKKRLAGEWFALTTEEVSQFRYHCQYYHDLFEMLAKETIFFEKMMLPKKKKAK